MLSSGSSSVGVASIAAATRNAETLPLHLKLGYYPLPWACETSVRSRCNCRISTIRRPLEAC
jgi:hypothetical protein